MNLGTAHRFDRSEIKIPCEICNEREAKNECECCGRLFCEKCGDLFYPNEEYLCYDCLAKIEREEENEWLDQEFLESYDLGEGG